MTQGSISLVGDLVGDWRDRAACSGYPNAIFFPTPDTPKGSIEKAIAICAICPVAGACLEFALETNQRAGVWGGTSEDQRRSLRRKWLASRRRST